MLCDRCQAEIGRAVDLKREAAQQVLSMKSKYLTPQQEEMLSILWSRRGQPVSVTSLIVLMYQQQDEPKAAADLIKVQICALRRAMRERSSRYEIRTLTRRGYLLCLRSEPGDARPSDQHRFGVPLWG